LRADASGWYSAGAQPSTCYKLLIRTDLLKNGTSLDRRLSAVEVSLYGGDSDPQANSRGTDYGPFWVRAQVEDVGSDTVIRGKVWTDGNSEPTAWDFVYTDTTSGALYGADGGFGFRSYAASEATNPVDNRIDDVAFDAPWTFVETTDTGLLAFFATMIGA